MVAALAGVAVAGALLVVSVDLADNAVRTTTSRASPGPAPAAHAHSNQLPVELTELPESERVQKRSQRRRLTPADTTPCVWQHIEVINAVRPRHIADASS